MTHDEAIQLLLEAAEALLDNTGALSTDSIWRAALIEAVALINREAEG